MSNSPILWGPNQLSNNLQNGEVLANGTLMTQNGAVNYVSGGNFANGTVNGFTLGTIGTLVNGLPTGTPTFGSGAAGALSLSAVSSTQSLAGYALSLVSSAATTAGNMVASPVYSIATQDQGKVLTVKGYYSTPTGVANANYSGTSANTLAYAIWDVTNSSWLSSAGNFNFVQGTGTGYFTGTAQTNITTTQIRVVAYFPNASAGAITVNLSDIYCGPQTAPMGPAITDWNNRLAFTYTNASTVTNNVVYTKQVGDTLFVSGNFTAASGPNATFSINLPAGLNIDVTKINTSSGGNAVGMIYPNTAASNALYPANTESAAVLFFDGSNTGSIFAAQASTSGAFVKLTGNALLNATNQNTFQFSVPIAGWSSNTAMSADTDTRVVAFSSNYTANYSYTSGSPLIFNKTLDTHGAYNASTGGYTIPVSGIYIVGIADFFYTSGSSANFRVYRNGGNVQGLAQINSGGIAVGASIPVSCAAGDIITIVPDGTGVMYYSSGSIIPGTYIYRLSGPAVVSATESVNMRYFSSATAVSGSLATVMYSTKGWDTHNAYNPATGIYTAPVSGKYQVNASIAMTGTFVLNSTLDLQVQQTGSATQTSESKSFSGGAVTQMNTNVGDIFYMLAGDQLKVQASNSGTTPVIAATTTQNWISLARVGN